MIGMDNPLRKPHRTRATRGMTFIELAIVIGVIVLLLFGLARTGVYFREEANKNICLTRQKAFQDAVRAYANMNNVDIGAAVAQAELVGTGKFFETMPTCPKTGNAYTYTGTVPAAGASCVSCSTAAHAPTAAQLRSW